MISAKEARDITNKAIKELDMIGTEILTIAASGLTSVTFDFDISKETQQILKKLGYDVYYECRANDSFLTIDWSLCGRKKDD